jgi:hypothetical protein
MSGSSPAACDLVPPKAGAANASSNSPAWTVGPSGPSRRATCSTPTAVASLAVGPQRRRPGDGADMAFGTCGASPLGLGSTVEVRAGVEHMLGIITLGEVRRYHHESERCGFASMVVDRSVTRVGQRRRLCPIGATGVAASPARRFGAIMMSDRSDVSTPGRERVVYRVHRLSGDLHSRMRIRRVALGQTVREFVAYAVRSELPGLVAEIADLLPRGDGDTGSARLPFPASVLAELQDGSRATEISGTRLLTACLTRATGRRQRKRAEVPPAAHSAAAEPTSAS